MLYENLIKSLFLTGAVFLSIIIIKSYKSNKKIFQYLNIDQHNCKLVSHDKKTGRVVIKNNSTNEIKEFTVPNDIIEHASSNAYSSSKAKNDLSKSITNELKENFISFGNIKDLNMNEKLIEAKKKLDYFNDWIHPDTQTYHRSFIIDEDMESFCKLSKEYILKIQTDLLDAIQRDLGASDQQVEERQKLNQIATKINEFLNNTNPSPRYRS